MGCKSPRKSARRVPRRREGKLDDELSELATVLAEREFDVNAAGWFKMPWRDGWHAVGLMIDCWRILTGDPPRYDPHPSWDEEKRIAEFLHVALIARASDSETYWQAEEMLRACPDDFLRAGLRCLQLAAAKSSGGGEVYNVFLKIAFDTIASVEDFAPDVMEQRCRDAIGTTAVLQGNAFDRVRKAFVVAWNRRMYASCYALPSIETQGAKA